MNHKNLLLILFFCLFLTPFMANGATVGGYFQIDVNVLRDGNNNPISLNNIALYRDEQSTFPEFFTGETIYEGYSYTSLYQELTVGQSYKLGFGNMVSKHVRENDYLAGMMAIMSSSTNCSTACSSLNFACDDYAQQQLAYNLTAAEYTRIWALGGGTQYNTASPSICSGCYWNDCSTGRTYSRVYPAVDLSTVTCTATGASNPSRYAYAFHGRLCACGGWRIIVTI